MTILQNTNAKYKFKQCSLEFISNDMRFPRKIMKKMWSKEIITNPIAL